MQARLPGGALVLKNKKAPTFVRRQITSAAISVCALSVQDFFYLLVSFLNHTFLLAIKQGKIKLNTVFELKYHEFQDIKKPEYQGIKQEFSQ